MPPPAARRDLSHLTQIQYGGDYNPEQWTPDVWREDVALMQAAGVNLVSVGIFSWARLEPREGVFDFGWLDEVMDLLHAGGIGVNLATATASPPPWMAARYPDSLPVDRRGRTLEVGSRQQYCPHSFAYQRGAYRLVTAVAERYRSHPALRMWHLNNEYGCHVHESFTPAALVSFRQWLADRYGDIGGLNDAWGTAFWSQRYDSFEEIPLPGPMPTLANPLMQLDWRRFSSWAIERLMRNEIDILRSLTPDVPVNTNFMGFFRYLDYWSMAEAEDVVSNDAYPDPADPRAHLDLAAQSDLMRSLRRGQPWILMEQTSSTVNWRPRNVSKRPGQMRLWSMQCVARGADGIMFFQWRASKAGAERFHGAMVPHAGADSRVHREIVELGADLAKLSDIVGTRVHADVGIVFDWENWWAVSQHSHPSADITGREHLAWHGALYRRNITSDYVSIKHSLEDLRAYKLVLVPNLYAITADFATVLTEYVRGGGHLVVGPFSGIVDKRLHVGLGGYPAALRDVLGIRIEQFEAMVQPNTVMVDGARLSCDAWHDVIQLRGSSAIGAFADGWFAGAPAITRHQFGEGSATYVGTVLDDAGLDWLLGSACHAAQVLAPQKAPDGVEIVQRIGANGARFTFVLNHTDDSVLLPAPSLGRDALTGLEVAETVRLDSYGVLIIRADG
jgi:beta-galactosidase